MEIKNIISDIIRELKPSKSFSSFIKFNGPKIVIGKDSVDILKFEKIHFISIGKAALQEMNAILANLKMIPKEKMGEKIIYTKSSSSKNTPHKDVTYYVGDHPFTTRKNIETTQLILDKLSAFSENDLIIYSISGGTSALLEKLHHNFDIDDFNLLQEKLLSKGLSIDNMNMIRKSLSLVKNGGLLTNCPSQNIIAFISSDFPNNEIINVGSSPLTFKKLNLDIIFEKTLSLNLPIVLTNKVKTLFSSVEFENIQLQKRIKQTEKNIFFQKTLDSTKLKEVSLKVINQFYEADYVNKDIPTYDCTFDELIQKETSRIINSKSKKIFISCGEAPVTLTNEYGQGGRNTHFCAVMSKILYQENGFNLSVPELEGSWIISLATDASDGDTDCAGGLMTFEKFVKIEQHQDAIVKFDTYNLLNSIDALIKVKQTGINLMDLRIIYIHRI